MILPLLHSLVRFAADTSTGTVGMGCDTNCDTGLPAVGAGSAELQMILKVTFGILAAVAVLLIVIAGLKFTISQSDPQEVAKARETIIYAVVGLVIAISAEIFVSFVLNRL